jgi:hypothetical protein
MRVSPSATNDIKFCYTVIQLSNLTLEFRQT